MKKWVLFGMAVCLFVFAVGCHEKAGRPSLSIEPAQLTEQEENIAALLGLNTEHHIFDFTVDDKVQSLQFNTYEMLNGEWRMISGGGGQAFSDAEGRIALGFDRIAEGIRIAVQSEHTSGSTSYGAEPADDLTGMGCATSFLSSQTEIVYEQEIPLVVQIITAKNQINSYTVEFFNSPEKYAEYEHVYAVTVRFSQKTVSELSSEKERA